MLRLGQGEPVRNRRLRRVEDAGLSALYHSITAYWSMDAASGSEFDLKRNNYLTAFNGVGSAAGVVGTARSFASASVHYMDAGDVVDLRGPGIASPLTPFWLHCWVYLDPGGQSQHILSKMTGVTAGAMEYRLFPNVNNTVTWYLSDGTTVKTVNSTAVTVQQWTMLDAVYNGTTVGVWRNAVAPTTSAWTTGIRTGSGNFRLGASNGLGSQLLNGRLDQVFVSKGYVPTQADLTFLYNGGAGRTFTQIQAYNP